MLINKSPNETKFVSRGGSKLEHALHEFEISPENKLCLDMGASTGGFTDCLLSLGAKQVYAVDVGYGQLAFKLRNDPRVVVIERTNARYLTPTQFPCLFDIVTIDVSFISLEKILPVAKSLLADSGIIIALVKPNFEVGKGKVGKKGVVRKPELHIEVLKKLIDFSSGIGLGVVKITHSPLKGPEGNIEYFMKLLSNGQTLVCTSNRYIPEKVNVEETVKKVWERLNE